jgi:hypothetical protein
VLSAVLVADVYLVSETSSDTTKALNAIVSVEGNLSGIPFGLFVLLVAWEALRGVPGTATGPVVTVGALALAFVWVLATSIYLLRPVPSHTD